MKTLRVLTVIGVVGLAAGLATAQPRGGGDPGQRVTFMANRLADRLQLSDEQRVEYDQVVATYADVARERMADPEFQALREQFRSARESGDLGAIEAARAEMRAYDGGPIHEQFAESIEPILTTEQLVTMDELREALQARRGRGPGRGEPGARIDGMATRLSQELALTADQQTQFDGMVATLKSDIATTLEQMAALRPQVQELRSALESGDTQRAAELRAELESVEVVRPRERMETFMTDLREILTDEQLTTLDDMRENWRQRAGRGGPRREQVLDPRTLMQVLRRLDLTSDQQTAVRGIIDEARGGWQKLDARDRRAQADYYASIKADLFEVLDADQIAEFETLTEGRGARDRGAQRGQRLQRGAQR